mgnify:CR=1 FL=1
MSEAVLLVQIRTQILALQCWRIAVDAIDAGHRRVRDDRDRGEVTATTALIVILVIAALAAAGVIANKITNNAEKVPEP